MKTSNRFKIKTLTIALLLAAGPGGGQAAINPGTIGGSSGELFLSVWDQAAATSYSFDMGLTVDDFLAAAATPQTWILDSRFQSFASTGGALTFNIAGSNGYPGIQTGGVVNSNFGFLPSHLVGSPLNPTPINNAFLGQIYSAYTGHIQYLNNAQVAQNPGAVAGDYAANLSEITTSNSGSYFNNNWGVSQSKIPWNASAKVRQADGSADQTLDLYFIHANPAALSAIALIDPVGSGFQFSLDPAAATLTYAPVPLPASVWLFSSALAGLGLFKPRNRAGA